MSRNVVVRGAVEAGPAQALRPLAVRGARALARETLVALTATVLAACWLVRPIVRIQITDLYAYRLGTVLCCVDYWLRRQKLEGASGRRFTLFVANPRVIANRYLVRMMSRRIPILVSRVAMLMYAYGSQRFPKSPVWFRMGKAGNYDYETWGRTKSDLLRFTPEELARGERLLREMGVPEGAPFICFAARDRAYLDSQYPPERQSPPRSADFWQYHDFRDSDIDSYVTMAEWFAARGFWVLRMGAVVEKPLRTTHPRIIDYASKHRSEFGDIYLLGRCKFFIGDSAGFIWVPAVFGVPCAIANFIHLSCLAVSAGSLFSPKQYRRAGEAALLPYPKVFEMGADRFGLSELYRDAGLEPVCNTPEEILALAQEMNARIDGTWAEQPGDEALTARYWAMFAPDSEVNRVPLERRGESYARVAASFLRSNAHLIG
jgi:putative glycosyltransferase (TIGR04372 family)